MTIAPPSDNAAKITAMSFFKKSALHKKFVRFRAIESEIVLSQVDASLHD